MRGPLLWAIFGGWLLALALFAGWAMQHEAEPLCAALADGFEAACVTELPKAADYLPGTLLDRDGAVVGSLVTHCVLPGAASVWPAPARSASSQPLAVVHYNRLAGSGLAAVPAPAGALVSTARGGEIHDIALHAETLQESTLGKGNACLLQESCAERLRSGEWRLVNSTVAATVRYRLQRDDGVRSTLRLPEPRVIGARVLDNEPLAALVGCASSVSRSARGNATAFVASQGRRGAFAPDRVSKPLGEVAITTGSGTEVSDCDPGVGRERSRGYAQALIALKPDGVLQLSGEVRASSGRYRFGRCGVPGRRLPSNNTLVTRATAGIAITGELALALRSSGPQQVRLGWHALPEGTELRIDGPSGAALWQHTVVATDGEERITLTGPGVFLVRPSLAIELRRQGESGVISRSFDGTVRADTGTDNKE